jgi:plastocyanin
MKTIIGSKSRMLINIAILFAIFSISNSCTKNTMYDTPGPGPSPGPKGGPGTNEVWIQGMAFGPATITVTAGTTIKWTNKDGVAHTVTSSTGLFDSGTISNNGTYSLMFATAGTFPYYCAVHPGMKASVVVE